MSGDMIESTMLAVVVVRIVACEVLAAMVVEMIGPRILASMIVDLIGSKVLAAMIVGLIDSKGASSRIGKIVKMLRAFAMPNWRIPAPACTVTCRIATSRVAKRQGTVASCWSLGAVQ